MGAGIINFIYQTRWGGIEKYLKAPNRGARLRAAITGSHLLAKLSQK
jgi:hypothetical protein